MKKYLLVLAVAGLLTSTSSCKKETIEPKPETTPTPAAVTFDVVAGYVSQLDYSGKETTDLKLIVSNTDDNHSNVADVQLGAFSTVGAVEVSVASLTVGTQYSAQLMDGTTSVKFGSFKIIKAPDGAYIVEGSTTSTIYSYADIRFVGSANPNETIGSPFKLKIFI